MPSEILAHLPPPLVLLASLTTQKLNTLSSAPQRLAQVTRIRLANQHVPIKNPGIKTPKFPTADLAGYTCRPTVCINFPRRITEDRRQMASNPEIKNNVMPIITKISHNPTPHTPCRPSNTRPRRKTPANLPPRTAEPHDKAPRDHATPHTLTDDLTPQHPTKHTEQAPERDHIRPRAARPSVRPQDLDGAS